MQTRIAAVSLFVGLTSCVGTVPDPPLPTTDTPAGSVSIEDYPANADTWCSVGQELPTHEVLLSVAIPNGKGATPIVLKLIRCQSTTGFRSSPMAAVSADSMEPRAWFNGSVYVTSSNADSLKADVSFSFSPNVQKRPRRNTSNAATPDRGAPVSSTAFAVASVGSDRRLRGSVSSRGGCCGNRGAISKDLWARVVGASKRSVGSGGIQGVRLSDFTCR